VTRLVARGAIHHDIALELKRCGIETKLMDGRIESRLSSLNPALLWRAYSWWDRITRGR
jgi:hypothetical protein